MNYIREIFARMFLITRKWEILFNRDNPDLTLKQLMCLIVINNGFEIDPSIKEVSVELSTSHQNVKALVLQLERKGFVNLYKDAFDKRITRVKVSEEKIAFWKAKNKKDDESLMNLFDGIDESALKITLDTITKLDENVNKAL